MVAKLHIRISKGTINSTDLNRLSRPEVKLHLRQFVRENQIVDEVSQTLTVTRMTGIYVSVPFARCRMVGSS